MLTKNDTTVVTYQEPKSAQCSFKSSVHLRSKSLQSVCWGMVISVSQCESVNGLANT